MLSIRFLRYLLLVIAWGEEKRRFFFVLASIDEMASIMERNFTSSWTSFRCRLITSPHSWLVLLLILSVWSAPKTRIGTIVRVIPLYITACTPLTSDLPLPVGLKLEVPLPEDGLIHLIVGDITLESQIHHALLIGTALLLLSTVFVVILTFLVACLLLVGEFVVVLRCQTKNTLIMYLRYYYRCNLYHNGRTGECSCCIDV